MSAAILRPCWGVSTKAATQNKTWRRTAEHHITEQDVATAKLSTGLDIR